MTSALDSLDETVQAAVRWRAEADLLDASSHGDEPQDGRENYMGSMAESIASQVVKDPAIGDRLVAEHKRALGDKYQVGSQPGRTLAD